MQFSTATIAAVAAFLPALVSAHVKMINPPTVFKEVSTDLNPLDPSGSNYPCFVTTGSTGELPLYQPGSQQEIGLQGSAVHGGGSCQISITYDNPPTKGSVFKVIKSFEGGCPGGSDTNANLPANPQNLLPSLPYTLPATIASGEAVVAWTWFNKIGNREMYMRCAPIKIGGSNTDKSAYNALPDMFKANIGNQCSTTEGINVIFPNPGSDLTGHGTGPPVGQCGTTGNQPPELVKKPTPTPTPTPPPVPSPDVTQTPVESPTYTSKPKEDPKPTPSPSPYPTPAPEQPPTNGTECQTNGAIVCTGSNSFAMCDFGKLIPMGPTAAGTSCVNGQIIGARSVRFSHEHRRRHGSRL